MLLKMAPRGKIIRDGTDLAAGLLESTQVEPVGHRLPMPAPAGPALELRHPAWDCACHVRASVRGVPTITAGGRWRDGAAGGRATRTRPRRIGLSCSIRPRSRALSVRTMDADIRRTGSPARQHRITARSGP